MTSTAKGFQTVTSSETHMNPQQKSALVEMTGDTPSLLRRRSSSICREEDNAAPMQIIGSINETGLGLVSWWT